MKTFLYASLIIFLAIPAFWFVGKKINYWQQTPKEVQKIKQNKPLITNQLLHYPNSKADTLIEKFRTDWQLAAISVAVAYKGKIVFAKAYGQADTEQQEAAQPYHLFRMASVSKLITAAAIMKLVETGKIRLDSKVFGKNGILNDTIFTNAVQNELVFEIEVQHLLRHTAGWWNKFRTDPMFVPLLVAESMKVSPPPSLENTMIFMLSQKKLFRAGTLFDYSNFGYCVLGKVIEKVSGQSYENFVKKNLLDPIGIQTMQLGKTFRKDRQKNEVCYYDYQGANPKLSILGTGDTVSRAYGGNYLEPLAAAGAWIASGVDLLKFVLAIDGLNPKTDILNKESIELMTQASDSTQHQEIGWRSCDTQKCWRSGSLAGTNALVWQEKNGFTWVFLSNTSTWRGPRFSFDIISLMNRVLPKMPLKEKEFLNP